MKLIINIGNTRTHCAVFQKQELQEYSVLNKHILEYALHNNCNSVYAISVNNKNRIKTEKLIKHYFENIIYLTKKDNIIKTNYTIKDIGIDRFVNIVYAIDLKLYPSLIMDFGTADTFDYIDKNARHIGGLISPGLMTMLNSLCEYTEGINNIKLEYGDILIGKNTSQAVNAGIFSQWIAGIMNSIMMADRLIDTQYNIITGGNAKILKDLMKDIDILFDENFTLKAINHYAENYG